MQNKEIGEEKSVNEKNLEVFNRYFPGCLSIENDNQLTLDTKKLKALLGDFSEIKEEGYGLDFVGKKIALNQAFKKNHKILKPLNESTSKHILIKGDNLDALKILKQSYSEKIKMIYIDPPYNTKNENFIYGDDFSQSNEEVLKTLDYSKEKLDYIKNLFGSKCHSGWLSFMYPRLLLARDLLKQDGVIFISIDDNEAAQLKLLCDEIFGEGNFLGDFIKQSKVGGGSDSKFIVKEHEYCLVYAKNINLTNEMFLKHDDDYLKRYKEIDDKGRFFWDTFSRRGLTNPIIYEIKAPDGTLIKDGWIRSEETFKKNYQDGEVRIIKIKDKWSVQFKQYLNLNGKKPRSMTTDFGGSIEGKNDIINLFNSDKIFSYPKSIKFISTLLKIATNEGDIILDFFAGSGTTAHAVLESNKSDYQKLSEGGGGYLMA
ncbi:type III restriction-modification system methylation subunit [Helicobacter pylori 908]|nr:type III restriction-modification system methylation subunit [Helicobacter pylori 908]